MTRFIDLTQTYTDQMPVYPGDPCAKLYLSMTLEKDGCRDEILETGMHVGTHMDAPIHMIEGGIPASDIPLEQCSGSGVLIDVRGKSGISSADFDLSLLKKDTIAVFRTDWSEKFRESDYFENYPVLLKDTAHCIANSGVKMVVLDTPSPDAVSQTEEEPFYHIHKILLGNNILIVENACNLSALDGIDAFTIHAQPTKFAASGAPVRLFAEITES